MNQSEYIDTPFPVANTPSNPQGGDPMPVTTTIGEQVLEAVVAGPVLSGDRFGFSGFPRRVQTRRAFGLHSANQLCRGGLGR